jgi:hypothetical protein
MYVTTVHTHPQFIHTVYVYIQYVCDRCSLHTQPQFRHTVYVYIQYVCDRCSLHTHLRFLHTVYLYIQYVCDRCSLHTHPQFIYTVLYMCIYGMYVTAKAYIQTHSSFIQSRTKMTEIVVDVVYVNSVTWTAGCERVRAAKQGVGQLLANQRQGWMGIRHHKQRSWFSK